jgi:hypothetical protein
MRSHRWNLVVRRLARTVRARWRPLFLVTGALLMVVGVVLPGTMAFVPGMLVLGLSAPDAQPLTPTTAMVRGWLPKSKADHL